jgi:hypothetical protein
MVRVGLVLPEWLYRIVRQSGLLCDAHLGGLTWPNRDAVTSPNGVIAAQSDNLGNR